jgi:hypothetical protein
MKMKARTIDAPAPTAIVYDPHNAILTSDAALLEPGAPPAMPDNLLMIPYMIPR